MKDLKICHFQEQFIDSTFRRQQRLNTWNIAVTDFFVQTPNYKFHSKVTGIDRIGKIGFVSSTSNAFEMYSLAVSTSPRDSKTSPKLYLKFNTNFII